MWKWGDSHTEDTDNDKCQVIMLVNVCTVEVLEYNL